MTQALILKEPEPAKLRQKIEAGLSRDQAIDVLERQAEYDARNTRPEKKSAK